MKQADFYICGFPILVCVGVCILMISAFVLMSSEVRAHPHVFIAQRLKIIFDDKGLAGINAQWEFDEMFTAMIVEDYDCNRNGKFEPDEIAIIKEKAFFYIKEFSFFHFIRINTRPFRVKYIKNFQALIDDKKLIYEFFIPCHVTATNQFKKICIATYDPTYYTAIFFTQKKPFSLISAEAFNVKTAVKKDPETKIYFDMIHPWALFLEFKWKQ